jgi:hypothetical protein
MTPEESLRILRLAKALSPAQAVDEFTPEAWTLVLRDVRYADAEQALIELGGEQEWIHVSHIRRRVKRIRDGRVRAFGALPEPPREVAGDDAAYSDWLRDVTRRIADGEPVEVPALPAPDPEHAARMAALIRSGGTPPPEYLAARGRTTTEGTDHA